MRWSEFIATLSVGEQAFLINTLTLGCGATTLAMRLSIDNGSVAEVVRQLAIAQGSLRAAQRMIGLQPGMTTVGSIMMLSTAAPSSQDEAPCWQDFLTDLGLVEATRLLIIFEEVAAAVRRGCEVVLADGDVTTVQERLSTALRGLRRTLRLLQNATIP